MMLGVAVNIYGNTNLQKNKPKTMNTKQNTETAEDRNQRLYGPGYDPSYNPSPTQPTPGPWKLSHQLGEGFSVVREVAPICGRLIPLAMANIITGTQWADIGGDEARANARLIAAAPDLLAACKALLESSEDQLDQSATVDGLANCNRMANARAAIAKAERGDQ